MHSQPFGFSYRAVRAAANADEFHRRAKWIRRLLNSPYGLIKVASLYGPFIWMVMSLAVIPALLHRPPAINIRWLVQLIGHIPFVGIPIVASIGRGADKV